VLPSVHMGRQAFALLWWCLLCLSRMTLSNHVSVPQVLGGRAHACLDLMVFERDNTQVSIV
jgi:hypothetical protein